MHQPQVQSQEEELQELRHCDFESVQGMYVVPLFQECEARAVWEEDSGRECQGDVVFLKIKIRKSMY